MDAHKILGISPGVSDKEIKAAYKKLAKQYHPDLNNDPGAEQKFKEISQAYAILTGKEKEQQAHMQDPFQNFHDQFESMFRTGFSGAYGGGRMVNQIMVDPEMLLKGGEFKYQFQVFENRGGRLYPKTNTIDVRVEPDTPAGVQIAVSTNAQNKHTFIQLIPVDTARYHVTNMIHLTESHSIDVFKAMTGGEHEVITPLGKTISIKIPPGSQTGSIHRIRGGGLRMADGSRGDYNIQLAITIPAITETSEEEIKKQVLEYLEKRT